MSIRHTARGCAAAIAIALTLPAAATGATVSFNGNVLVFQAAPGEDNALMITRSHADYECGELMPACVVLSESVVAITSFPAGRCMRQTEQAGTIECVIPESVIANLGDRNDSMWDWDGPSVINAGDGDDEVDGGAAADELYGDQPFCVPSDCPTGADRILARDGAPDRVRCGAGEDLAVLDPDDTIVQSEQVDRCERVDVAAAGSSPPCSTCDPSGQPGCSTCAPSPPPTCSTCQPSPPRPCCPAADGVRPAIRDLRAQPMRARRETTIRFTLSEAATVTLRLERRLRGRYVRLPGRLTHAGRDGANVLRFGGRIGGRRLKPGRYRLVAAARDAAGNVSARAHAALIVRR